MTDHPAPALSVVLGAPDGFDAIRRTVAHLRAQDARERVELLLVTPPGVSVALDAPTIAAAIDGIGSVRVVEVSRANSGGAMRAAGARAAQAPVVAFAEDHCFPDPAWAGAFIRAHSAECAAVGPAIRNANPGSVVSWADIFIGYGPWLAPGRRRAMRDLPGHNSSYKRDVLLSYGDALDELMESETLIFWDLRARGLVLLQEPGATAAHMNFGLWGAWLRATLVHGRLFAATRARGWSRARRAAWTIASPLIPFVRLARTVRSALDSGTSRMRLVATAPAIVVGLAVDAAGQATGYALGAGDSKRRAAILEAHRERYVRVADRPVASDESAASATAEGVRA